MKFNVTQEDKVALCRQSPEFLPVVEAIELQSFNCQEDSFAALVWSVISQQLSGRVAQVIGERAENLLGGFSPEALATATFDDLRSCGLSARKIEYIQGIAQAARDGRIDFKRLSLMTDAEIIAELTQLKGVGVWTVEMLLIFAFARKDVLSYKDLGIRTGLMRLHKLETLTEKEFESYRHRYTPYGTLASLYLWRIKDAG